PVGFSTHERPDRLDPVKLAVAKGAVILERHVGIPTERYPLNAYSSTPTQAAAWIEAALAAARMCGSADRRAAATPNETKELLALRRGLFAREAIAAGQAIDAGKVFFAIPTRPGQFTANDFSKYADFRASADIPAGGAIGRTEAAVSDRRRFVTEIVQQVRDFVRASHVPLPTKADVEISHHYGPERFAQTGAVLLSYVNRSYCKKAIVMLPGQSHPEHWHRTKEETFFILHGSMSISLNGAIQEAKAGDSILVEPGVRHAFSTRTGVIFEEISSTHVPCDSFYGDPTIMANPGRKTRVTYWID
ncbi:MAG: cupin domain-containing protein, partial [Opitutaceae bacterium]